MTEIREEIAEELADREQPTADGAAELTQQTPAGVNSQSSSAQNC